MTCRITASNVSKVYTPPSRSKPLSLLASLLAGHRPVKAEEIRALDAVSLTIEEGERIGIIGPNGAGKSTLLHLIAGLSSPSTGSIHVQGRVHAILTLGTVLREEATGRENIYLDGEIQGKSHAEIESLIGRIIDFSELGDFIDMPVRTYSSGMKARLGFSMIAFIDPEILIVDEVLSVGDVQFSWKATRRMKELTKAGRIVLVVSHGIENITDLCTRCIWLDHGRVIMDGDPWLVTEAYIAAVNAIDEVELRRKFDRDVRFPGERDGGRLASLVVHQEGAGQGGILLMSGRNTILTVSGSVEQLKRPDLRLRLTRLDGSVIAQSLFSDTHPPALARAFIVELRMRPLVLGPGVYRADVDLLDGGIVVSTRSKVFEVRADYPLIGGIPTLLYPSSVAAQRIENVAIP